MSREPLIIRPFRSSSEARITLDRIEAVYKRHRDHKSKKLGSRPDTLLVAERDGEIVGAAGLFLLEEEGVLAPTEEIFGLDLRTLIPRTQMLEVGRLVSLEYDARFLAGMIVGIRTAATQEGRCYGLACTKPHLLERLRKMALVDIKAFQAEVQQDLVPTDYRGFFTEGVSPVAFLMTAPSSGGASLPPEWGVHIELGSGPLPRLQAERRPTLPVHSAPSAQRTRWPRAGF